MKLYKFLFNPDRYDSCSVTMSIHKTKAGAYKAMKSHKVEAFMEWYDDRSLCGKRYTNRFAYDYCAAWGISEIEVQE